MTVEKNCYWPFKMYFPFFFGGGGGGGDHQRASIFSYHENNLSNNAHFQNLNADTSFEALQNASV